MAIMYKKILDKLTILTNDNIEITLKTFFLYVSYKHMLTCFPCKMERIVFDTIA